MILRCRRTTRGELVRIRLRGESAKLSHRAGGFAALMVERGPMLTPHHESMKNIPTSLHSKKIALRGGELMIRRCEKYRIASAILYFI